LLAAKYAQLALCRNETVRDAVARKVQLRCSKGKSDAHINVHDVEKIIAAGLQVTSAARSIDFGSPQMTGRAAQHNQHMHVLFVS